MNLVDMLTKEELEAIDYYRQAYGRGYGETYDEEFAPVEDILQVWSTQKQELFRIFGEQLILRRRVSFQQSEESLTEEFSKFFCSDLDLKKKLCNTEKNTARYNHAKEFVRGFHQAAEAYRKESGNNWRAESWICSLMNSATLANGSITFKLEIDYGGKILKLEPGMKTLRAIHKFTDLFKDNPVMADKLCYFHDFSVICSQLMNTSSISGELCLSIHPLDYMTMSDNDNNWRSCMTWRNGGEYKLGTVEMMNSPGVIVAYTHNPEVEMEFGSGYRWNNKKWRELFVACPDCLVNIKGYPYAHEEAEKYILNWLKELVEGETPWRYTDKLFDMDEDYVAQDEDEELRYGSYAIETDAMYNDFPYKNYIYPAVDNYAVDYSPRYYVNMSGPAQCMKCGTTKEYFDNTESCYCENCENIRYCSCCGERIDSEAYDIDDQWLCHYCYENETIVDPFDGEVHLRSNMDKISVYVPFKEDQKLWLFNIYTTSIGTKAFSRAFPTVTPEFDWHHFIEACDDLNNPTYRVYSVAIDAKYITDDVINALCDYQVPSYSEFFKTTVRAYEKVCGINAVLYAICKIGFMFFDDEFFESYMIAYEKIQKEKTRQAAEKLKSTAVPAVFAPAY